MNINKLFLSADESSIKGWGFAVVSVRARMRSGIIIALLSTLLYWGQAVPAPQHHQAGLPQHGMFPRVQTVYNRPPPGFFFFPSWESLMSHVEAPNTNTRVKLTNSKVEVELIPLILGERQPRP